MTKYTQLTCEQRYQIKALLKMYLLNIEIANVLGVNKSTINRELQRNRGGRGYRPKRAAESNNRQYPGDYVYNYVEGDSNTFESGVDYLLPEMRDLFFLKEQGAHELGQYLCAADKLYSDTFGWELMRTMTLAEGYEKCDFHFKRGRETRIAIPAALSQRR